MQINIALSVRNPLQAEEIRRDRYPNTTAKQIRDAFIFNGCIDSFDGNVKDLLPFIEADTGKETVQRMLTIKQESYNRLKDLAGILNKPIAATYRAVIEYTIHAIREKGIQSNPLKTVGVDRLVIEKVSLLEKQLSDCHNTLKEIYKLMEVGKDAN